MPKVSIIVPVYNTEKYLSKCLDSLVNQTLDEIEIICVNDGSTDNSLDLLNQYAQKDKRIKIIDFKENKGVSVARNSGIKVAQGEYIGFVDSDDFVDLDFYEKLYTKAKETGADIAKANLKEIRLNGEIILHNENSNILIYKDKLCFFLFFTCAIYKLSLIRERHCFFESRLRHSEDSVWLNRIVIVANKIDIAPNVYYWYQRRNNSADTLALSKYNAQSAYIGLKHIFLNTKHFIQTSKSEISICFQNYFLAALSFCFRSTEPKSKTLFCKLLFFFYHHLTDFYKKYIAFNIPSFCPYFENNRLEEFTTFMQNKRCMMDLTIADLRHNIQINKKFLKLSVIIPVYNTEDYLAKCLESICKQTYKNLQIICIDDCSTDASLRILKDFAQKDQRIQVIQRTQNGGQAAARQTGIDAATGDYIAFVDSDDWLDENYYRKMLEKAQQDETDIVVNGNILVHEGEKIYTYNFPGHKQLETKIYTNPSQLIDKFYCVVWNKLYKAEFLKGKKYTISERSAHEDLFFHYATFAFAKNVSFFDGTPYHYLLRDQSISHANHDWGLEHIKVYSQIYDFYEENHLLNQKIKLYSTMPFFSIKSEEMFQEYKNYFTKIHHYLNDNKNIFNVLDLFFADTVCECQNYAEFSAKCPGNLLMAFLRRKK